MSSHLPSQTLLFPDIEAANDKDKTSSSFVDNMRIPVHRWFRYSAGFSAEWVERVIRSQTEAVKVFDPFAGAATTLIAAEKVGAECYGVEAHPFVGRVAKAKLAYRTDPARYLRRSREVFKLADGLGGQVEGYPPLIRKCFSDQVLECLDRLRSAWANTADGSTRIGASLANIGRDSSPCFPCRNCPLAVCSSPEDQ